MKNTWINSITLDEIALLIFLSCVLLYLFMLIYAKLRPKHSKRQLFNLIYENWVENRLKDDSPLTSVQALRNFIMGCSTFVSILFILLGIIISFSNTSLIEEKEFLGFETIMLEAVELTLVVILILFSLFNFILATRYATRLSLIISGRPDKYSIGNHTGISLAQKSFKSAQNHWMFGVRGVFYLIATLLWFLDALFFIIATLLVTIYLVGFQDFWIFSKKK